MAELSGEERMARQKAVDFARGSIELSGGGLSPEIEALNRRYIAGDLSSDEHLEAMLAYGRSLPHVEPVQEYFTSFDAAMNTTRDR